MLFRSVQPTTSLNLLHSACKGSSSSKQLFSFSFLSADVKEVTSTGSKMAAAGRRGIDYDYSIPSAVVVSLPPSDSVFDCFHTVNEARKTLQRSTLPLQLCVFRGVPGLPLVSSISTSGSSSSAASPSSKEPETGDSQRGNGSTVPAPSRESAVEDIARWDRLLQHVRRFQFVTVAVIDGDVDDVALSF